MSKRKGVSKDEKRSRTIEYFYEKKEPFIMKELEKDLFKIKGIVAQTIPDIIKELIDDDLIECEKMGIINIYWAFPSKGQKVVYLLNIIFLLMIQRENKVQKLDSELTLHKSSNAALLKKIENAKKSRTESVSTTFFLKYNLLSFQAEREETIKIYNTLKSDLDQIEVEISKYSDVDPEKIENLCTPIYLRYV